MKKKIHFSFAITIWTMIIYCQTISASSIGQQYIDFLHLFKTAEHVDLSQEINALFSPKLRKTVNAYQIAQNRTDTFKQMQEIRDTCEPHSITVHEYLESSDHRKCAIRWEISYGNDDTTESVITIITADDNGLIEEINEVFGLKNAYIWP